MSAEGRSANVTGAPSRLLWSGDWWLLGAWIVAAVAGLLASMQAGVAHNQVTILMLAILGIAIAVGWIAERITRRPFLRMAPRASGMGANGVAVVFILGWWIVFGFLGYYSRMFDPLAPVPYIIEFMGGLQLARVIGRAVDRRSERASAMRQPMV